MSWAEVKVLKDALADSTEDIKDDVQRVSTPIYSDGKMVKDQKVSNRPRFSSQGYIQCNRYIFRVTNLKDGNSGEKIMIHTLSSYYVYGNMTMSVEIYNTNNKALTMKNITINGNSTNTTYINLSQKYGDYYYIVFSPIYRSYFFPLHDGKLFYAGCSPADYAPCYVIAESNQTNIVSYGQSSVASGSLVARSMPGSYDNYYPIKVIYEDNQTIAYFRSSNNKFYKGVYSSGTTMTFTELWTNPSSIYISNDFGMINHNTYLFFDNTGGVYEWNLDTGTNNLINNSTTKLNTAFGELRNIIYGLTNQRVSQSNLQTENGRICYLMKKDDVYYCCLWDYGVDSLSSNNSSDTYDTNPYPEYGSWAYSYKHARTRRFFTYKCTVWIDGNTNWIKVSEGNEILKTAASNSAHVVLHTNGDVPEMRFQYTNNYESIYSNSMRYNLYEVPSVRFKNAFAGKYGICRRVFVRNDARQATYFMSSTILGDSISTDSSLYPNRITQNTALFVIPDNPHIQSGDTDISLETYDS